MRETIVRKSPRFKNYFTWFIGTVKATDKDSGEHGKVYYHILEGNQEGAFVLDRTQGIIRANISFDRYVQINLENNLIIFFFVS